MCSSRSATGSAAMRARGSRRSPRSRCPRRRWARRAGVGRSSVLRAAAPRRGRSRSRRSLTVGRITTQSRWTGTWIRPPIACEAPKATWAVPSSFSSSSTLPVSSAFSLVPMPSSAIVVASSPCARRSSSSAAPSRPARLGQAAAARRSSATGSAGIPTPAIVPSTTSVPSQAAVVGRDEALAAGQVAEGRRGSVELAGVGDRGPALEAQPQVAAVGAGDPRLACRR